jgi:hypothetical protein
MNIKHLFTAPCNVFTGAENIKEWENKTKLTMKEVREGEKTTLLPK